MVRGDLRTLLNGPVFETIRNDDGQFQAMYGEEGTVVWPNGADLCPDVLISGGLARVDVSSSAA